MLSFYQQYSQAQKLVGDSSTATTTFLKLHINSGNQIAESELGSYFTEDTTTDLTEDGIDSYPNPDRCVRIKKIYVTVSGIRYPAVEVHNEIDWQRIKYNGSTTESDTLTHVFLRRDTYELYPTPASSGNTITIRFESSYRFMEEDDYTTGTITTLANGGTAVTGNGTSWDATFAGRYFKIDDYPIWYPISAYGTATTLTLAKPYQGTAIAAGTAAYTVGEFSRLPPSMHILPIYYACGMYYQTKKDKESAAIYMSMFKQGVKDGKALYGRRDSSNYIPSQTYLRHGYPRNPIDFPKDLT